MTMQKWLLPGLFTCVCTAAMADYGFEPPEALYTGMRFMAVAVGDVSGDGKDDLLALPLGRGQGTPGRVLIAVQQVDGTLAAPVAVQYAPQDSIIGDISLVDVDKDGDLDVFVSWSWSGSVFLRNEGNLSFTPINTGIGQIGRQLFDDVNEDGNVDMIATPNTMDQGNPMVHVYCGLGDGTFRTGTDTGIPGAGSLHLTDMDGDGLKDVVNLRFGALRIYPRRGDGYSATAATLRTGLGDAIAISDVDEDGAADFATTRLFGGSSAPVVQLHLQDQGGRFHFGPQLPSRTGPNVPRFRDLDGDGDEDLVVSHRGNGEIGVYVKSARGFQAETLFASYGSEDPQAIAFGDLDDDGNQDIVSARTGLDGIELLRGRDRPPGADLAAYVGLNEGAAAIRLENHGVQTATGEIYMVANLSLRVGTPGLGTLPAGCASQPGNASGVDVVCRLQSLAAGNHHVLILPLVLPGQPTKNQLRIIASASAGVRDIRPANNTASKSFWLPPPVLKERLSR